VSPPEDFTVRLNVPGEELLRLPVVNERFLKAEAIEWTYALRNRARWSAPSPTPGVVRPEIAQISERLGLHAEHLDGIVRHGMVEVDMPWIDEKQSWGCRNFPWEYMLASATSDRRRGRQLTVVRRLRVPQARACTPPDSWMQVVSAPGAVNEFYDFSSETKLIKVCFGALDKDFKVVTDPDLSMLQQAVQTHSPGVIHLTGVDNHQGWSIIDPHAEQTGGDGYFLRTPAGEPQPIDAGTLAQTLTAGQRRAPALIACNIYNSAGQIGPACLARGACAAICFQDSFDDDLAELFFGTLYQAWRAADWDLVSAFNFAWQKVRDRGRRLQGSGTSILGEPQLATEEAQGARRRSISEKWHPHPTRLTAENAREVLEVDVKELQELNYALLHNNGPIFDHFTIRKKDVGVGRVDGLLVDLELHVGTDSYPCRLKTAIEETAVQVDLPTTIRISLASALGRAIRESIHTSLFIEVRWENTVLYRETKRVTLLPVDEWRFESGSSLWLPSFVLPRDPAVLRVVDASQRYLMALRDDATAGFDGYQSVSASAPKPEECAMVDYQVRALWSALLYECPLAYINPPPTFTGSSQRLRTPSDCIDGKRGTCIDLALLLASCLEYVEIYPAIFLLKTHAFPAYWRHDSFHTAFRQARSAAVATETETQADQPTFGSGQSHGWDFQPNQYREILGEVQAGRLVPLETTLITGRGSFSEAVAEGVQNLASRYEFESMLDIQVARTNPRGSVTPLPIRRGEI
jgi:hypothetical protein